MGKKSFCIILALNHVYYLIKKVNNFYKMDTEKSGEDINGKCVRHKDSEKGQRYFK